MDTHSKNIQAYNSIFRTNLRRKNMGPGEGWYVTSWTLLPKWVQNNISLFDEVSASIGECMLDWVPDELVRISNGVLYQRVALSFVVAYSDFLRDVVKTKVKKLHFEKTNEKEWDTLKIKNIKSKYYRIHITFGYQPGNSDPFSLGFAITQVTPGEKNASNMLLLERSLFVKGFSKDT